MIGNTEDRNIIPALKVFCHLLCPLRRIPDIMDPVNVKPAELHQIKLHLDHILERRRACGICALRRKFVGYNAGAVLTVCHKIGKHLFAGTHSVRVSGIP